MSRDGNEAQVAPLATWRVPGLEGTSETTLVARPGETTTVVGANGVGKSALGLWLDANSSSTNTLRIIAHRRLWLQSPGPTLSSAQRGENEEYYRQKNRVPAARYVDIEEARRGSVILFDLLARENFANLLVARAVRSGALTAEKMGEVEASPIDVLNKIMLSAGLAIQVQLTTTQSLNAITKHSTAEYPMNEASDGEKAALLLTAEILVAPTASVLIIDEPERHLHRSISAGLISAVIAQRPDCHFVVLTHDLELADALTDGKGTTYALLSVSWSAGRASGWSMFAVDATTGFPESARRAILGGRRNLLFVEGAVESQDWTLYRLLFPDFTVSPIGGAEQVARTVAGLRGIDRLHWVRAVGIIDGDGLNDEEKSTMLSRGIRALPLSEVENLYYLSVIVKDVAAQQAKHLGAEYQKLEAEARAAGFAALGKPETLLHLAEVLATAEMRRRAMEMLPTKLASSGEEVKVVLSSPFSGIKKKIGELLTIEDFDALVRLLPIRDSAFRSQVAKALKFPSRSEYEAFVRVRLMSESSLLEALRSEVGNLPM